MITVFHAQRNGTFKPVAHVKTDDLEEAWQLTNTINRPWWENSGVVPLEKSRSSMVGDLFYVHADRRFWAADSYGHRPVDADIILMIAVEDLILIMGN